MRQAGQHDRVGPVIIGHVVGVWRIFQQPFPFINGTPDDERGRFGRTVGGESGHEAAARFEDWEASPVRHRLDLRQRETHRPDDLESLLRRHLLHRVERTLIDETSGKKKMGNKKAQLSKSMTVTKFDNGYWYATEVRAFAGTIGIPSASALRKDELERAIKLFLETGRIKCPTRRRLSTSGVKDVDRGLRLDRLVVVYTNDKETKDFLDREAQKIAPGVKRKSGVRYRLNRWREEQLLKGVKLTYGDVVREYVRLNRTVGRFAQIPVPRYVNFLSDFFAAEKDATRAQAVKAWKQLKTMDVPKDYRSWARSRSSKRS